MGETVDRNPLAHALAFGGLWVVPIEVRDEPLGLSVRGLEIVLGVFTEFAERDVVKEQVGFDRKAGRVTALRGAELGFEREEVVLGALVVGIKAVGLGRRPRGEGVVAHDGVVLLGQVSF